jgi:hypothetical protein
MGASPWAERAADRTAALFTWYGELLTYAPVPAMPASYAGLVDPCDWRTHFCDGISENAVAPLRSAIAVENAALATAQRTGVNLAPLLPPPASAPVSMPVVCTPAPAPPSGVLGSAPPSSAPASNRVGVLRITGADSSAKATNPVLTMNRTQAGTPNSDGWYPAHSEGGHFSVLMPAPFNDFAVNSFSEKGAPMVSNTIGTQRADGAMFSVVCMRGGDRGPAEALRAFSGTESASQVTPLTFNGLSAVEVHSKDPVGVILAVALPDQLCVLTVDPRGSTKTDPEVDAKKMFDSFVPDPAK